MINVKPYHGKLPKIVGGAIKEFSGAECILLKKKLDTRNNKALNCHYNVNHQVAEQGGKCINGWLLSKNSKLLGYGLWHWSYHSAWLNNSGEFFDITIDKNNTREFSTFVPDYTRTIDLKNGVSYNDIVIFENTPIVEHYTEGMGFKVDLGTVYWILNNLSVIRKTNDYNGIYRYLRPEFPENAKRLETDYNMVIKDGKLTSLAGEEHIHRNMLFEYSISNPK